MALFHFNSNKEVRINASEMPAFTSNESVEAEYNNTVWNIESDDNLYLGDSYIAIGDCESNVSQNDKQGRKVIEHRTIFISYSYEELSEMKDAEKSKSIQERNINKEKNKITAKFPEYRYDIEIKADGNRLEVYIYDKEYKSFAKSNPQVIQQSVDALMNGDFDIINDIKNPVEFLEAYRKKSGGKTMYSALISGYRDGKLSSDKVTEYLDTLQSKFWDFESDYDEYNPNSKLGASSIGGVYFELSNRVKKYFQREQELQNKYKNNEIDKEQVKDLQKFVKKEFNIELNEIAAATMLEDLGEYKVSYNSTKITDAVKSVNIEHLEIDIDMIKRYRENGDGFSKYEVDSETVSQIKQIVKMRTNFDITENEAGFIYDVYKIQQPEKHFDIEKLKEYCLSENFNYAGEDCKGYLKNILTYSGNGYNDSIESLEEVAQTTEIEYGRYNFDIHKSSISDLVRQSEKMIKDGEKELQITKSDDKIVIRNKSTEKERVIDLNMLTSQLDNRHKYVLLNAIKGFNKISLWEFAIEITNAVDKDIESWRMAIAQYDIVKDKISIGEKADSNTLLHEMVHAMMATIIDGKNSSNEDLFKEFVDTFKEEQRIHKYDKQLRNSIVAGGNYTYCADNIYEFAAEAGCLWLSGKSDSEFTIATHFPKSYRLFIQLIEKIRAQSTGRSMNENV